MRILFITTAHNGLSQSAESELVARGHRISIILPHLLGDIELTRHVESLNPDLIICPMLKTAIPEKVWRKYCCLIVHPGIKGDRGPSSLDWAILNQEETWGVTILQANEVMDGGPIWATREFPMRPYATKASIYRHEVARAGVEALLEAVVKFESRTFVPEPLDYSNPEIRGRLHVTIKNSHREIHWSESAEVIARKIRSADSSPGVLTRIQGGEYFLYGAFEEERISGEPGRLLAKRDGAVCIGTGTTGIWITHLKKRKTQERSYFKVPATVALGDLAHGLSESHVEPHHPILHKTYREIWYEQKGKVGYLHFDFYNGAMNTDQCERLEKAVVSAKKGDAQVLVLMGGDFWSNGIHLNTIEASEDSAAESWRNINAMNDLMHELITADRQLVISAIRGNAGAGGVILALAADSIFARDGIVLNPHYKTIGSLYGSEYWTYLLQRRVGKEAAMTLTEGCKPVGTSLALHLGLIDGVLSSHDELLAKELEEIAENLANHPEYVHLLKEKQAKRASDENQKSLSAYRAEELTQMWENFYGPESKYHEARSAFVRKKTTDFFHTDYRESLGAILKNWESRPGLTVKQTSDMQQRLRLRPNPNYAEGQP